MIVHVDVPFKALQAGNDKNRLQEYALVGDIHAAEKTTFEPPLSADEDVAVPPITSFSAADTGFEELLDVQQAAKLLLMHPKTLQALARAGTVPCVKMGKYWRFRASSLDAWFADRLKSEYQSRRMQGEEQTP